MSGFEIAGIVLGGLPIVLKAAEGYKQGLEPLVKWHRYKLGFRTFVNDVDIETQMFKALVGRLLLLTDLSDEQKEKMLEGNDHNGWCHAETEKALRRRLGPSFDACKNLLEMLEDDLIKLQAMLSLKDGSVDWARPGEDKWNYQRKRIAHSFSKKGKETMESLHRNIGRFKDLLDVLDERAGTTGKQEQRKVASNDTTWAKIFECIRKQALSLHEALKSGWKCTCDVPHMTSLQLQRRVTGGLTSQFILTFMPPSSSKKGWERRRFAVAVKEIKTADLTAAIRPALNPVQQEGYLNKLKSNVELSTPQKDLSFYNENDFRTKSSPNSNSSFSSLKKAWRSSSNAANTGVPTPPVSPGLNCPNPPVNKKPAKKVNWGASSSNALQVPAVKHSQSTPNLLPPNPPPVIASIEPIDQPEILLEITDLCSTLATCDANATCIGYLVSPEKHHHEFRSLKNPQDPPSSPTQDLVSLEALLNRSHNNLKLTRKQQYRLTVILASSLLQLQTTPWMTGKLEKKDIFFEYSGFEVFAEQPYISHSFPYTPPQTPTTRFATRASLQQLGIILLELCFGAPITAQTQYRCQYLDSTGNPHNDTDFLTARDWISDVEQEGGPGFQEAIKCCFNFDGKPDWGDKKFVQGIYEGVVRPLEGVLGDLGWGDGKKV